MYWKIENLNCFDLKVYGATLEELLGVTLKQQTTSKPNETELKVKPHLEPKR